MTTIISINNTTEHDFALGKYTIYKNSSSNVNLTFSANGDTKYTLKNKHSNDKKSFKIDRNGNTKSLDKGLFNTHNEQYINVSKSLGNRFDVVWSEPNVVPAYYNNMRHITIQ